MKKLLLTVTILLGGFTAANAQAKSLKTKNAVTQEVPTSQAPIKQAKELKGLQTEQGYKTISTNDLPEPIKKVIEQRKQGNKISNAAVNEQGLYRVEVSDGTTESKVFYLNKEGKTDKRSFKKQ